MIPLERQRTLLEFVRRNGSASFVELAEVLKVSQMTVRRDVQALEEAGRLTSVARGVTLPARLEIDQPHATKAAIRQDEKRAIAQHAVELVRPGDLILLDAGTTTLEIAKLLMEKPQLSVVTDDLAVARLLSDHTSCELFLAAGAVDKANLSTEGAMAAAIIAAFNVDIAFLSTPAFDLRGTSVPTEAKQVVKKAIVENAASTVLVTDASKYGRVATLRAVRMNELDAVITDASLPEAAQASIIDQGVRLDLVDPQP